MTSHLRAVNAARPPLIGLAAGIAIEQGERSDEHEPQQHMAPLRRGLIFQASGGFSARLGSVLMCDHDR